MATDAGIEEFIDYSWHPSEEEFVSPLTADQWEELLGDSSFAETDAAKAVRCLLDYGEPATFQQLSIRYRAAMGRYRRWLTDAARTAGERFGVGAPSKDQFGMDEWWPLLYQTRNAGKPGAGIYEMQLRPEVVEAYRRIDEAERYERRAKNARQLQRIEQLERARQEERRRAAERAQAVQAAQPAPASPSPQAAQATKTSRPTKRRQADAADAMPASTVTNGLHPSVGQACPTAEAKPQASQAPAASVAPTEAAMPAAHQAQGRPASAAVTVPVEAHAPQAQVAAPAAPAPVETAAAAVAGPDAAAAGAGGQDEEVASLVEALAAFVKEIGDGHDILPGIPDPDGQDMDKPDYATRYATRLADAFVRMREVEPLLTEADVARELGDESVERLQDVLLGRKLPSFTYVDAIARTLFVSPRYLEAQEAYRECVPIFASLAEVCGRATAREFAARLRGLSHVAIITEDARDRRTLVSCRIGEVSCCLITRAGVSRARRRKEGPDLTSYRKLAAELEAYCKAHDIGFSHEEVTTDDFETLQCGLVWPGWYCG